MSTDFATEFSRHRLRGDPPPHDLSLLLSHRAELAERTGIVLDASADWAPWLDTSYLSEERLRDPEIRANVRAINEVCALIDFVAADEDGNYVGYWRGPTKLALSEAPVVCLDNEGQFDYSGTVNIAGFILTENGAGDDLRAWLEGIGIQSLPKSRYDLFTDRTLASIGDLHRELYEKHVLEERAS